MLKIIFMGSVYSMFISSAFCAVIVILNHISKKYRVFRNQTIVWLFHIPFLIVLTLMLFGAREGFLATLLFISGLLYALASLFEQLRKDGNKKVYSVPIGNSEIQALTSSLEEQGFTIKRQSTNTITLEHPALNGPLELHTFKFSLGRLYKTISYSADNPPINELCPNIKLLL